MNRTVSVIIQITLAKVFDDKCLTIFNINFIRFTYSQTMEEYMASKSGDIAILFSLLVRNNRSIPCLGK